MRVRNYMEKAKKISEIRSTCRYYPLDSEDLAKFYVDTSAARGVDMLSRLTLHFSYVPGMYQHILYLGHKGSGKSTLMFQLEQKLKEQYDVIRFSVQESLDVDDMDFIDLLYAMYECVFNTFSEILETDTRNHETLLSIYKNWNATIEKESEETNTAGINVDSEAQIGICAKIVNLFTKVSGTLRFDETERKIIRTKVTLHIDEYIKYFNDLVDIICRKRGKPILLMFEDLEKIPEDIAERLFIIESKYFVNIKVHLLLTAPIYLKYSIKYRGVVSQYFTAAERCPMIAIRNYKGEKSDVAYQTMSEIVYARMEKNLISEEALDLVISYSGGLLRDLFGMLWDASLICEMAGRNCIQTDDIETAFKALKEMCSDAINEEYINLLIYIYNNPRGAIPSSSDFVDLMSAEYIIEYNGEQWRGLQPAVEELLKDLKKL